MRDAFIWLSIVVQVLIVPVLLVYLVARKSKTDGLRLLLFLTVTGYFALLVIQSAWHETTKCSGQGCLIVFPFAAFWYALAYALLLPAYGWAVAGKKWWQWLLAAGALLLSVLVLGQMAAFFDYSLNYLPLQYYKSEWAFHHLVRLQLLTGVLLLLVPLGRLVWQWFTKDLESEVELGG